MRELYCPQISAYWKAVTEMIGIAVAAGIYSTSTGQFIDYDSDELATEWERIENMSPADSDLLRSRRVEQELLDAIDEE